MVGIISLHAHKYLELYLKIVCKEYHLWILHLLHKDWNNVVQRISSWDITSLIWRLKYVVYRILSEDIISLHKDKNILDDM